MRRSTSIPAKIRDPFAKWWTRKIKKAVLVAKNRGASASVKGNRNEGFKVVRNLRGERARGGGKEGRRQQSWEKNDIHQM